MPRRSFAQYHHQHERESKPMISTESASPAKRLSSGERERSLKLSLEASELRYRRLFETAQDGILILDANTGKIIDVNPFLLDLLDYPFENMIGQRLWEIGQFKDIAANQAAFETLQENEYIRYENLPLRSKAGKEIHVEFISNVYFVGSDKVIQCNIRDISARLVVDQASHGRLAALELANQSKDDLLAVLSHELRTPLTAISCAADLLELGHDAADQLDKTEVPPQFDRSAVAMIRRNLQAMVRLISELLDLTHMATLTALPLYLWFFGLDWFQVVLFFVLLSAIGFSVTLGYHGFSRTLPYRPAGQFGFSFSSLARPLSRTRF